MSRITEDSFAESILNWVDELWGLELDDPGSIDEVERIRDELETMREQLLAHHIQLNNEQLEEQHEQTGNETKV